MQHTTEANHTRRKTWADRKSEVIEALIPLKIVLEKQVVTDLDRDPYLLAAVEAFLSSQSPNKKNSLFARLLTVNGLYTQGHLKPFSLLNIHSVNALTQFGNIHLEQDTAFLIAGKIIRYLPNQEVTCSNISETKEQVSIIFQCGDKTFTIILDAHLNRVIQANNINSGIEIIHSALRDQSTHIDLEPIVPRDTLQKVSKFLTKNSEHAKTSPQEVAKLSMFSRKTKMFSTKRFFAIPNYTLEFELDSISLPQGLMAHHENDTLFLSFNSISVSTAEKEKLIEMLININNFFDLNLSMEALESHELITNYPDIFQPKEIFLLEDDTVAMKIAIYYGAYQIDSNWYLPSKIILTCMPLFLQNYFEPAGQDSEITPLTPDEKSESKHNYAIESKRDSDAEPADNDNIIGITTHGDRIYCHYHSQHYRRALLTQIESTQAPLTINIMGLPIYFQNKISKDPKFSCHESADGVIFYGDNLQEHCKRHGHLLWVPASAGSSSTQTHAWHGVVPFNRYRSLTDDCREHCTSGDHKIESPDFLAKKYKTISPHIIKDIARRPALRKLIQQHCSIVHSNKQTIIYTGNYAIYQALQNYDQSQFVRHYVFTCFMQTISLLGIQLKEPQDNNMPDDIRATTTGSLQIKYTNTPNDTPIEINSNPQENCRIISSPEYENDIFAILQQIEDTRQKKILSKIFSMNKQPFIRAINETPVNDPLLKMKKITQILRDGAATLQKSDKNLHLSQTMTLSTCMAGFITAYAGFSVIAGLQVSASLIKPATPLWTAALHACVKNPYCYLAAFSILSAVIAAAIILHLAHKQQTKQSFYSTLIGKTNNADSLGSTTQNQSKPISEHVKSVLLNDSEDLTKKCLTAVYLRLGGSIDGDVIENITMKNDATSLLRSLLTSDKTWELSLLCPNTNIDKDDPVKVSSVTCSEHEITIQYTINKGITVEKKISRTEIDNIINTSTAATVTS